MSVKAVAWVTGLVLAAIGGGWVWGASGKAGLDADRRAFEERAVVAEVRVLVLEGRVSLYLVNFGDASRRFEAAYGLVEEWQKGLRETGQAERAGRLEVTLGHLREAQRLAASLDQSAQTAATEALASLDAPGRR